LSKITITIPSNNEFNITNHQEADLEKNSYRILSFIVRLLYNYQLPLHDAFITSNKVVLILSDKDAAKTYETLRKKCLVSKLTDFFYVIDQDTRLLFWSTIL
jgi:hypothetical protein